MVSVFGFFSGALDESHELRARAFVRTACTHVDARYFRVKIIATPCRELYGRVSANIQGAECAIERIAFPHYEDLWTRRGVPKIPETFSSGHVKGTIVDLCRCLPEYQSCSGIPEAEALEIKPPISSVGFIVDVRLFIDELPRGANIRGIVALSDVDQLAERRPRARDVDASPAEDGADLSTVAVAGDGTASVDKS
jgi:hypothetical protein